MPTTIDLTAYTALVNDDGSNTTGTLATKANILLDPILTPVAAAIASVQTTTSTGTVNDFALTDRVTLLRCNNASLLTLTGIAAGYDGQRLIIESVGAGQVDLSPQAAGSTAANRLINFATVGMTSLAAGNGVATYVYDATTARWKLHTHFQGAWITPTFAAGDYTATTGNWTVASGDVISCAYLLEGRKLTFKFYFQGTTVSATPVNLIRVIPGGYTAQGRTDVGNIWRSDNAGTAAAAGVYIPAGTAINFYLNIGQTGTWATATDTTAVVGMVMVEVQ